MFPISRLNRKLRRFLVFCSQYHLLSLLFISLPFLSRLPVGTSLISPSFVVSLLPNGVLYLIAFSDLKVVAENIVDGDLGAPLEFEAIGYLS